MIIGSMAGIREKKMYRYYRGLPPIPRAFKCGVYIGYDPIWAK